LWRPSPVRSRLTLAAQRAIHDAAAHRRAAALAVRQRSAAGQLDLLTGGVDALLVRVDDWDVPLLTDYQEEAAAAAVVECLQQNYGIAGVDIGLTFDREWNRYRFTWDGVPAEPIGPTGAH
jgi:hypothetical protein